MSWPVERINFQRLKPAKAAEDHALHIAAVEWSLADPIVITGKQDIKSAANWRDRFEPYDHQVQNLIRFCRMLPAALLADDVRVGNREIQNRESIRGGLKLHEPTLTIECYAKHDANKFHIGTPADSGATP